MNDPVSASTPRKEMLLPIDLELPARPRIVLGSGKAADIGGYASEFGWTRPLIITDQRLVELASFGVMQKSLESYGLLVETWPGEVMEPTAGSIIEASEYYRCKGCDGLIAIGGGSCLDTAKAAGVLLYHHGVDPRVFKAGGASPITGCLPVIAIPTTAGAGSEVTNMSLFEDGPDLGKALLRHDSLRPRLALIDPALTLTLPPQASLYCGIDAFCHAVECYAKPREHPYADALALKAARLVFENLPMVMNDPGDLEARENMSAAALIAGLALDSGGLQFHAFAHALGVRYNLSHGLTCGLVLTAGLRAVYPENEIKLSELGRYLGLGGPGGDRRESALNVLDEIDGWLLRLGLPQLVDAARIEEKDLPGLERATLAGLSRPMEPDRFKAVWKEILRI